MTVFNFLLWFIVNTAPIWGPGILLFWIILILKNIFKTGKFDALMLLITLVFTTIAVAILIDWAIFNVMGQKGAMYP
jgi:hypothetical protein